MAKTNWNRVERWAVSGMGAASFIAVTQLSTRIEISFSHLVAICCFGLCLPSLILTAALLHEDSFEETLTARDVMKAFMCLVGVFLTGCFALFCSFGTVTGG